MKRKNGIAIKLLIVSIAILVICGIISELDVKYNILKFDTNDFVGTFIYYTIIAIIYLIAVILIFLLYSFVKSKFFKK